MKNILFVLDTVEIGGAPKLTFDLINELDKERFNFRIIYLNRPRFTGDNLLNFFDLKEKSTLLWYKHFRVIRRILYMYKNFRKYDLVHSCMEHTNIYTTLVKNLPFSDFKLVISYHGLDSAYTKDSSLIKPDEHNFLQLLIKKNIQNYFFKKVNLFISVCKSLKEYMIEERKIEARKIKVVYHGLNINYMNNLNSGSISFDTEKVEKEKNFNIGYIGRFGYSKGLEGFVEVIPEIIKKNPEIKFTFKGDGELKHYLENRVNELLVGNSVKFENFGKNVFDFYKKIDLLILPSFYETTNLTVLEAMYSGVLVLTSDAGGLSEIIIDNVNGFMFKVGDFNELPNRVTEIKNLNDSKVKTIKKNAYQTVNDKFDFNKNSKNVIREFENLINDSKPD